MWTLALGYHENRTPGAQLRADARGRDGGIDRRSMYRSSVPNRPPVFDLDQYSFLFMSAFDDDGGMASDGEVMTMQIDNKSDSLSDNLWGNDLDDGSGGDFTGHIVAIPLITAAGWFIAGTLSALLRSLRFGLGQGLHRRGRHRKPVDDFVAGAKIRPGSPAPAMAAGILTDTK
jgi:hypothetical protein